MTMQIVLLCDEGLVFAGDLLQREEPKSGRWQSWRRYHGTKLKIDDKEEIFIACARNMDFARSIADELIKRLRECPVQDRGRCILDIGEEMARPDDQGAECIVMFASPKANFFHLHVFSDGTCKCRTQVDRSISGDVGNPASFWIEMYFLPTLPIARLVHLGAHAITAAGNLSSGNIGGLEIVTAANGRFEKWSDVANRDLEEKVKATAFTIGGIVLGGDSS